MTAEADTQTRHDVSLAVWDIPTAEAGGRFAVKVGAKSAAGCALAGGRVEVLSDGAVVGSGVLGGEPWPGTAALYWTAVELRAGDTPGAMTLEARFDASALAEPHQDARASFRVAVVGKPDHVLTVTVMAGGAPIEAAIVRLGPVRATTDRDGVATVKLAKGRYELVVWKAGFDIAPLALEIEADAAVAIEARALPEHNPDAVWTA
jgi:hypothetical protein